MSSIEKYHAGQLKISEEQKKPADALKSFDTNYTNFRKSKCAEGATEISLGLVRRAQAPSWPASQGAHQVGAGLVLGGDGHAPAVVGVGEGGGKVLLQGGQLRHRHQWCGKGGITRHGGDDAMGKGAQIHIRQPAEPDGNAMIFHETIQKQNEYQSVKTPLSIGFLDILPVDKAAVSQDRTLQPTVMHILQTDTKTWSPDMNPLPCAKMNEAAGNLVLLPDTDILSGSRPALSPD